MKTCTCFKCTYCYYDGDGGWDCYLGKMGKFKGAYDKRKCENFISKIGEMVYVLQFGDKEEK